MTAIAMTKPLIPNGKKPPNAQRFEMLACGPAVPVASKYEPKPIMAYAIHNLITHCIIIVISCIFCFHARLGKANWSKVRKTLQSLLSVENSTLQENEALRQEVLVKQDSVTLHLPVQVPGYTDFYSSKEHATNVGSLPCLHLASYTNKSSV